jgi:FtsZ-interacting cell division protein ZipA
MKMKKRVMVVGIVAVGALMLAGCGQSKQTYFSDFDKHSQAILTDAQNFVTAAGNDDSSGMDTFQKNAQTDYQALKDLKAPQDLQSFQDSAVKSFGDVISRMSAVSNDVKTGNSDNLTFDSQWMQIEVGKVQDVLNEEQTLKNKN